MAKKRFNPRLALEEAGILEPELQEALDKVNAEPGSEEAIEETYKEIEELEQEQEEQTVEETTETEESGLVDETPKDESAETVKEDSEELVEDSEEVIDNEPETEPANEEFEDPNIIHLEPAPEYADDKLAFVEEHQELAEAFEEIQELNAQIDSAAEDVDTVMKVMETIEDSESTGGLNQSGAEFAEIVVNDIARRQGIEYGENNPVIATEGFASPSMRIYQGQLSLEGLGDTVKRILKAIGDGIRRVIQMAKDFYNKLFDANTQLRDKVAKQLDHLRNTKTDLSIDDSMVLEGKYDKKSMIRYFDGDVEKNISAMMDLITKMSDVTKKAKSDIDRTREILFEARELNIGKMQSLAITRDNLPAFMKPNASISGYEAPENMISYRSERSYAGSILIAYIPGRPNDLELMAKARWFMGVDQSTRDSNLDNDLEYLKTATGSGYTSKQLLEDILKLCNAIDNSKRSINDLQSARDKLSRSTNKVMMGDWFDRKVNIVTRKFGKDMQSDQDKVTVQFAKDAANIVRTMMSFYSAPVDSVNMLAIRMGRAALDYANESISLRGMARLEATRKLTPQSAI